jgi:phosphate transport system permease protein
MSIANSVSVGPPTSVGQQEFPLNLAAKRRPGEALIKLGLRLAAAMSILTTLGIMITLVLPSVEFFQGVNVLDFLFGITWAPNASNPIYGVFPLVAATMMITLIALAVAVPIGLGAALYLSEYASKRVRRRIKPILELLAGVPSVVYGFFALTVVTPVLLQDLLGLEVGFTNALAAGLVLGVMIIPTVASLSEDAFSAVPNSLRQGSFAMGATRMQTAIRVVFPAALSGVAGAIVLGISRAVGETMIVALAAGSLPNLSADPRDGMQAMTGFIAVTAGGENPVGSVAYNTLFAVALLLFLITMVINAISIALVRKYRQVY